ncbi:MAG: DUF3791 domain-containing protein [Neisseriaceae bacterium]|nr:DUF3791 domain-containing protein [Neisseriaceae bacterium]
MNTEQTAVFIAWCIEEYAVYKHKTQKDTANLFYQNGVLSFLQENADILHTQGKDYILGAICDFMEVK